MKINSHIIAREGIYQLNETTLLACLTSLFTTLAYSTEHLKATPLINN